MLVEGNLNINLFVEWFSVWSTWTLFPLMAIDKLVLPTVATMFLFLLTSNSKSNSNSKFNLSYTPPILLFLAEFVLKLPPPPSLPDLYPLLNAVLGCSSFIFSYLFVLNIITSSNNNNNNNNNNNKIKQT